MSNARKAISIMSYGEGRFTLACALFTKWALMFNQPDETEAAQKIFDEAFSLYPDLERVIQTTGQFESTKVPATALARGVKTR